MSENPRVRQIAKAIWTFGCAERPEGVKKAQRLLESFPSGPPFVKYSNLSPLSEKIPNVREPKGSANCESNLDVRLRRAPRRGEKSPKAFRIIPVRSAICRMLKFISALQKTPNVREPKGSTNCESNLDVRLRRAPRRGEKSP